MLSENLSKVPRARLEDIAQSALDGLATVRETIDKETSLHQTVQAQAATITNLNQSLASLNEALVTAIETPETNEDYFRSALEEILNTLKTVEVPPDGDLHPAVQACVTIKKLVDNVLPKPVPDVT